MSQFPYTLGKEWYDKIEKNRGDLYRESILAYDRIATIISISEGNTLLLGKLQHELSDKKNNQEIIKGVLQNMKYTLIIEIRKKFNQNTSITEETLET